VIIEGGAALVAAGCAIGVLWLTRRWGSSGGAALGTPSCARCGAGLRGEGQRLPERCPECGRSLEGDRAVDWSNGGVGRRFFGAPLLRWGLAFLVGSVPFRIGAEALQTARWPMVGHVPVDERDDYRGPSSELIRARVLQEAEALDRATSMVEALVPLAWCRDGRAQHVMDAMDDATAERLAEAALRWTPVLEPAQELVPDLLAVATSDRRIAPWVGRVIRREAERGLLASDEMVIGQATPVLADLPGVFDAWYDISITTQVEPPLPDSLAVGWGEWSMPRGYALRVPNDTPPGRRTLTVTVEVEDGESELASVTVTRDVEFVTAETWNERHPIRPDVVERIEAMSIARIAPTLRGALVEVSVELPMPPRPALYFGTWSLLIDGVAAPIPADGLDQEFLEGGMLFRATLPLPATALAGERPDAERFALRFTPAELPERPDPLSDLPPTSVWQATSVEYPIRQVFRCRSLLARRPWVRDVQEEATTEWRSQHYSFLSW
jgi:hypothetical protein